ncbi:S8 family peptidase [Paenibacillus tyrfis]|uniref:S8 family peptidase n=1 Tax=Paenibacillus tyrfis TaxID=1501230 RepID=UPI00209F7FD0|nr:S8 family peptidase [Paenibacillus tyrfis]MCP1310064.1 S8 family peptidase [Paenibacillus tyrfis]
MDPSTFVSWLHEAMEGSEGTDKRHIIQFLNDRDYASFARQIGRQRKSLPRLHQIQPLRLIRAISCTLRTGSEAVSAPFIRSIEPDTRIKLHALGHASSALPSGEEKKSPVKAVIPWGVRHIRAPQAWSKSRGERVRIGVIDTGADYTHPDLRHCLSRGVNILNRQLPPIDDNGHGTHIAGTIAAHTRHRGIIGVAPQAVLHPVKAFDQHGGAFVSDIIGGIDWCVSSGVDIINMSFGMRTYSKALEAAVLSAYRSGIIVVASSGNEGNQAQVDYPARLRQVIAVGATTRKSRIAPFSNIGKQINIYAPGEKVYSTWLRGKYHELSGTSMATSHVTGVIALMLAKKPGLKPLRIKNLLRKHARYIVKSRKMMTGAKEIHAFRSVSAVSK